MSYVVSFPLDARCRPEKRCRDGVTVARRAGGFRAACWAWSAITSSGESWGIKPQRSVERTEFDIVLGSGRLPICAFRRAAWKEAPCQARCRAGVGMALQFRLVLGAQDLRARRHLGTGAVPLSRSSAMRDVRVPVGRPVRAHTPGRRRHRRATQPPSDVPKHSCATFHHSQPARQRSPRTPDGAGRSPGPDRLAAAAEAGTAPHLVPIEREAIRCRNESIFDPRFNGSVPISRVPLVAADVMNGSRPRGGRERA